MASDLNFQDHQCLLMATITRTTIRNLTLLSGSSLSFLAATLLSPALPKMALDFQSVPNSEFLVKFILTIPTLFMVFGALFAGILLDRWKRKPILILSLTLYGLSGSIGFFLDSLIAILVSRALLGFAAAGVISSITTLISDYFTGTQRNKFLGYQGAFIGLGGVVFLLLAGWLAEINWRYPFLIYLYAFLILLGVLLTFDEPTIKDYTAEEGILTEGLPFPWKRVIAIYTIAFITIAVYFVLPVQLPFYLTTTSQISSSLIGLAVAMPTLVSIFFSLQYFRIDSRLTYQIIAGIILLTLGVGFFIISSSWNYFVVLIGLSITGIGMGLFPPNTTIWLISLMPPAMRGRGLSGLFMAISLGAFFSPIIIQPIAQQAGLRSVFFTLVIFTLVLAGLLVLSGRRRAAESVEN